MVSSLPKRGHYLAGNLVFCSQQCHCLAAFAFICILLLSPIGAFVKRVEGIIVNEKVVSTTDAGCVPGGTNNDDAVIQSATT